MIFVYFLIFAMPFYHHPIIDSGSGMLTPTKAMGVLGLATAGLYVIRRHVPDYLQTRQAKLFLAMVALAFVSFLIHGRPPNLEEVGSPIVNYASMVVFFVIVVSLVDTTEKIRHTLLVANVSIAFASLYILREYQEYHTVSSGFRPGGKVLGDANYFSLAAMLTLPIGYFYLMSEPRPFYRRVTVVCVLITSVAIAVSGSRGGLLALFAFIAFVVMRSRRRLRNFCLLVLILIPPMLLVPKNPISRMLKPDVADRLAVRTRIETWKAGIRMCKEHPLMGIGLGEFKTLIGTYAEDPRLSKLAHNTYLEIAAELGIVCLIVYLFLIFETYRSLRWTSEIAKRMHAPLLYGIATGMQGGIVGFLVSSFFLSAEYVKVFWFYVFFSIVLVRVSRAWARQQLKPSRANMGLHG